MRRILLLSIIVMLILIGFRGYLYNRKTQMTIYKPPFVKQRLKKGQEYKIETIRVQKGHEFEIKIHGMGWIKGYLLKKTPVLSRKSVIDLFNSASNPRVILFEELDNAWIVGIKLTVDDQEVNLISWLEDQGLLFN